MSAGKAVATTDTPKVRQAMVDMVKALYGKVDGVSSADLRRIVGRDMVQFAAARLREMGVAVVADRARHNSRWWMLPVSDIRYEQWADRVLWDFYAEAVRAHRAVKRNPLRADQAKVFQSAAVAAGTAMGKGLSEIDADLAPLSIPAAFGEFLRKGGYLVP